MVTDGSITTEIQCFPFSKHILQDFFFLQPSISPHLDYCNAQTFSSVGELIDDLAILILIDVKYV